MCGIFGYLNYNKSRTTNSICKCLLNGVKRMEYRGYDSAGLAVDLASDNLSCDSISNDLFRDILIVKNKGKVEQLVEATKKTLSEKKISNNEFESHVGIAHTRWATHGPPSDVNSHPQSSNANNEFVVVHNGVITNFKQIKALLADNGYHQVSETDTELVALLLQFLYDTSLNVSGCDSVNEPVNITANNYISELDVQKMSAQLVSFAESSKNYHLKENKDSDFFLHLSQAALSFLQGTFAFIFKSKNFPNQCVVAKQGSPLIIGVKHCQNSSDQLFDRLLNISAHPDVDGKLPQDERSNIKRNQTETNTNDSVENNSTNDSVALTDDISNCYKNTVEYIVSSDTSAIVEHTDRVIFLEERDVGFFDANGKLTIHKIDENNIFASSDSSSLTRQVQKLELKLSAIEKGPFATFMEKEIYEQTESIVNTQRGRVDYVNNEIVLGGLKKHHNVLNRCKRLIFIACGTSYHSALAVKPLLNELLDIPIMFELASGFTDANINIYRDDACVFISQSGETADTLNALARCKEHGALCVGITNVAGSSISRLTDCGIHLNAGPEIGVASTKAYTSQIVAVLLLCLWLSRDSISKKARVTQIIEQLQTLPELIMQCLKLHQLTIRPLAESLKNIKSLLIIGRGYHYASCMEAALKVKELSYIHSEGMMSGELKHGTLALVDEHMPMIVVIMKDALFDKSVSALQQVVARNARPIVVCDEASSKVITKEGYPNIVEIIKVPDTVDCLSVITAIVPLQLLSLELAIARGKNVDQPRNLAKSVTVE